MPQHPPQQVHSTCDTDSARIHYGEESPHQFGDLYLTTEPASAPTVVVVHGGFWRPHRGVEMTAPIASDLAHQGWNAWNLEYRRQGRGKWQTLLDDCARGVDYIRVLASNYPVDPGRTALLGHSAGGQLAMWVASCGIGAVRPMAIVSLAGILDLRTAARDKLGQAAVCEFLGSGPDGLSTAYEVADPMARLPVRVPVRCLHSRDDERVPYAQSERYVRAAYAAGNDAALIDVFGSHTDLITRGHPAWQTAVDTLTQFAM